MKSLLIGALLVGGMGGASAAYLLILSRAPSPRGGASIVPSTRPAELEELGRALAALEEENTRLRQELELLALAPSREPVTGFVAVSEFEAFRQEVRAALSKADPARVSAEEASEVFEEKVSSALLQIRQQEQFDAVREYHEKRSSRLDEDLDKLADWLGMSSGQAREMRRALLLQYDREAEQARRWEAGEDPEVLGELKRTDGEAFDRDLRTFLSGEQADTFWARVLGGEGKDGR